MHTLLVVVTVLIIIIGIAGTALPLLPGIPLAFLAIAAYGWYDGFVLVSTRYLIYMAGLTLLSVFVDYLATYLGAKHFGSSKKGVCGAVIGSIAGLFIFPPFGLFVGPWLGAFLGERLDGKDNSQAMKTGIGTVIGVFSGIAFKILLGLIMLISFLIIIF